MDLLCCATRARVSQRGSQLFSEGRRFGSHCVADGVDGLGGRPSYISSNKAGDDSPSRRAADSPRRQLNGPSFGGASPRGAAVGSSSQAASAHKSDQAEPNSHGEAAVREESNSPKSWRIRGSSTPTGAGDPFLMNGIAEPPEEAAALQRLEQLAVQVRGQVRVRQQSPSKSYGSFLPPAAPSTLHMELLPGTRGAGFEPWVASEVVLWDGEKAAVQGTPRLASIRLLRISKVRHLDKHDGGCCMRLRTQQADSHEVCEELLVHASEEQAKACSEALVEAINLVRALAGRSVHSPSNEY